MLKLCNALGLPGDDHVYPGRLPKRVYYLLGWLVGDAVKQFASGSQKARIGIGLCKKHTENLALGEYVSECIKILGVPIGRIADEPPRPSEPHGAYRWLSSYSLVVSWLKTACLGLARAELTSYVPVKMDRLLAAPAEFRLWFLRGLADSDGTVNLRNKAVFIVTSPNTDLVRKLLDSMGCHNTAGVSKGVWVVAISAAEAARIQIFNPEVLTHRRKLLEKLCSASTFQRHWPDWLETRVEGLLSQGLGAKSIRDVLLNEDRVYVKMKTLKRKWGNYQR
ncbi:MAG: LAGLIDADG family homing endonuclease [Thaumarchaeota archaeon]|nr:LAGLIDADG family homing endonuclease [Nitrososphaerota archaeon]